MPSTTSTTKKTTRKPVTEKRSAAKPAAKRAAKPAAASAGSEPAPAAGLFAKASPEQRFRMVQEAAYLLAEKDGFKSDPHTYWVTAEKQFGK